MLANKMDKCYGCRKKVYDLERQHFSYGKLWHANCLRCIKCFTTLIPNKHCFIEEKPYCSLCSFDEAGSMVGGTDPNGSHHDRYGIIYYDDTLHCTHIGQMLC